MHRFWNAITRPILEVVQPKTIVEIGSDLGYGTALLLDWAVNVETTVHVVDPSPKYSVAEWSERYGASYVPHLALSLEVIDSIENPGIVLIDGDHNWYTVVNELRRLRAADWPFPPVLLHDVGWPYGRRDLYYDPATIPAGQQRPHALGGLVPGMPALSHERGINHHLNNATFEGGPENGVLTAVEDFVAESDAHFEMVVWPGIHGLALVFNPETSSSDFIALVDRLKPSVESEQVVDAVEHDRIGLLLRLADLRRTSESAIAGLQEKVEKLSDRLTQASEANEALRAKRAEAQAEAEQLLSRVKDLADKKNALEASLQELRSKLGAETSRILDLESELANEVRKHKALRGRRSVRLALMASKPARPAIRLLRYLRRRFRRVAKESVATSPHMVSSEHRRASKVAVARSRGLPNEPQQRPQEAVDIIVCVHNAPRDVEACLSSIAIHTNLIQNNVIIVDDGSDAETRGIIDRHAVDLSATVIRHDLAHGYTRAANAGLRQSSRPYAILLNSDTIVTEGWLERLTACAGHRPDVGVVGPWSNAASWQSIPELHRADGSWLVNPKPAAGLDGYARLSQRESVRLWPEVSLVNGFCYLITRTAINSVGLLDEQAFPRGYGEEDDYSIRCLHAGLHNFIADDCYVYHSKSRSFTPEGRGDIVKASKVALAHKHDPASIRTAILKSQYDPDIVRARTHAALLSQSPPNGPGVPPVAQKLHGNRIAWASPHLQTVGGVRRKLAMTNLMARWGLDVTLVTPDGERPTWMPCLARVVDGASARREGFDLLIISDPDVLPWASDVRAGTTMVFHLAAYAVYRPHSDILDHFYYETESLPHLANSTWTQEQVLCVNPKLRFLDVIPGAVDRRVFHPRRVERTHDVVCYGSTRGIKGTDIIQTASAGHSLLKMVDAAPTQDAIAGIISAGRVFVSAAKHEGFNLPPLEAMACGVPVVMTDDGGSRDYAVPGVNATVVPVGDVDAIRAGIADVLSNPELAASRIQAGMETAWELTWETSTTRLLSAVERCFEGAQPANDGLPPGLTR